MDSNDEEEDLFVCGCYIFNADKIIKFDLMRVYIIVEMVDMSI